MSGNKLGGQKSRDAILAKNPNHYKEIGRRGGLRPTLGGFKAMKESNPELHKSVSAKGGKISRKKGA